MGMGIATAVSMGPQLPHAFQVFPQLFSILVNLLHELMVQHGELQPTDYLVTTVAEEEAAAEEEDGATPVSQAQAGRKKEVRRIVAGPARFLRRCKRRLMPLSLFLPALSLLPPSSRHQLAKKDPVHTINFQDWVRTRLGELQELVGQEGYQAMLQEVDPDEAKQLERFL